MDPNGVKESSDKSQGLGGFRQNVKMPGKTVVCVFIKGVAYVIGNKVGEWSVEWVGKTIEERSKVQKS